MFMVFRHTVMLTHVYKILNLSNKYSEFNFETKHKENKRKYLKFIITAAAKQFKNDYGYNYIAKLRENVK